MQNIYFCISKTIYFAQVYVFAYAKVYTLYKTYSFSYAKYIVLRMYMVLHAAAICFVHHVNNMIQNVVGRPLLPSLTYTKLNMPFDHHPNIIEYINCHIYIYV